MAVKSDRCGTGPTLYDALEQAFLHGVLYNAFPLSVPPTLWRVAPRISFHPPLSLSHSLGKGPGPVPSA